MPAQNLPGLVLDRAHPLARGLVGWWPMNEGGGGNVSNIVNVNRPGVGVGGPARTGSPHGNAAKLDGSTQYYTVSSAPELDIPAGGTLTFWGIHSGTSGQDWGIGKDGPGNRAYGFGAGDGSGSGFKVELQINGNATIRGQGPAIAAGMPYFYAATGNATIGWIAYLNGVKIGTAAWIAPTSLPTSAVWLGNREYNDSHFAGTLWNARIYNRALSAVEVAQLYADPLAGALAPSRAARFCVLPAADPPAVPVRPLSADRLNNRTFARNWRRGETG